MADSQKPDEKEPSQRVQSLLAEIAQYDREFAKWDKRAGKIEKRYKDEDSGGGRSGKRFNILWSNVQTLIPATFSRLPQPDVSRRFRDNDPVGRVAALLLERCLEYEVQHYPDYAASLKQSVLDRFLGGRGVTWVRYEPHFRAVQESLPTDGAEVSEDIDEPQEELDYECSPCDYVHRKDFGHTVARTWEEVPRVWRVVYMYEDAVEDRFGEEIAKKIPYDSSPEKKDKANGGDAIPKQAKIYEIWDKDEKKAIWLSKSLGEIIEERDDPLGLSDFWPCPRPLFATLTNDSLVPVPDFALYQDQADELDVLSERIDGLVKALQVKGVHDASVPELARLFTEGQNGDLIPVKNFQAFAEKQGLKGAIDLVDLTPIAAALRECYTAMAAIKDYVYEITGISDIVRGQSVASETLGAQQIKQNFVGLRLRTLQNEVAAFAAQLLAIKGQIICGKYSPETIVKISAADQLSQADQQYIEPAIALLVGPERMQDPTAETGPNPLRAFRIDVEADSLVQMDEAQEKQDRMEFLKSAGAFLQDALPVAQGSPQIAPLLVQMLKFGVTAFKVGKTIEGDFDQILDQLKQAAQQPQQPKPDPEQMKIQAQQAADQARLQADQQANQARMVADQQAEAARQAMEERKAQREAALRQQEMMMEQRFAAQQAAMDASLARFEAILKARTAVEVAEISAASTVSPEQTQAAQAATQ